jgi:hypothetical protein
MMTMIDPQWQKAARLLNQPSWSIRSQFKIVQMTMIKIDTPQACWSVYFLILDASRPALKKAAKKLAKLASPAALPRKCSQPQV